MTESSGANVPRSEFSSSRFVHEIADLLEEKKVQDLVVLDVSDSTTRLADYMIIATGLNGRQVRAVAEDLGKFVKGRGSIPRSVAGADHGFWVCIDLGDVIVHVMQREARAHYDLEALWADARVVRRGVSAAIS